MKNLVILALSFFLTLAAPALAQTAEDDSDLSSPPVGRPGFPEFASDVDIATLYFKLTGQAPDFERWARFDPQCRERMTETARVQCLDDKQAELRQKYQLQTTSEAIAVPFVPAIFSAYSKENGGYVVKNFTEDTYMPFTYAGRNYAIIPQGLMDRQFLPISGLQQKDVENALRGAQRKAVVLLYIQPSYADKTGMVELDGKQYSLISGKVVNIGVYNCRKNKPCTLLWEEGTTGAREAERNDLLNLKQ
ncbi:MAG TPA: hypothetical protein VEF76_12575 [Patescibacteria group bacterium]|nr:hypothetical protein [Patescibacteria group bacterium]